MEVQAVKKRSAAVEIIAAAVIAVLISLVLILLAALLIKATDLSDAWLAPLNQVIRGLSLFFGALLAFRERRSGWLKGLVLGVVYIVFAFLIFSLIDMTFNVGLNLLWDILFGAAMGVICGILAVNIRK